METNKVTFEDALVSAAQENPNEVVDVLSSMHVYMTDKSGEQKTPKSLVRELKRLFLILPQPKQEQYAKILFLSQAERWLQWIGEPANKVPDIRNRDIALLTSVLPIMQAIRALEERGMWERERMTKLTQNLSGMPHGGKPSGFDEALTALDELHAEHRTRIVEYTEKLLRAEAVIRSIPHADMQAFVLMVYVEKMTPKRICSELNMQRWKFFEARSVIEQAENMASVMWKTHPE